MQLGSPLSPQDITAIIFTNAHFQGIGSAMDVCNNEPLLETGGTCLRPGEGVVQYFRQLQDYKNQLRDEAVSDTITHPELVSKLENLSKSTNREWLLNKMIEELESVGELIEQSEFLKRVKVYQNQASLEDLGKLVKIEIKEAFSCSNKDTDVLYNQLFNMVKSWWTNGTCYLDPNSHIWHSLVNASVAKINNKFHTSHRTISVTFREEILECVKNEVYRNQVLLIQSPGRTPSLSVQKVCQALQGDKYVIATATDDSINSYIHVCESRWCNILVLEVLDAISSDLSKRICAFLNRGPNKRVIIVSTKERYFSNNYCCPNHRSITNIDNNITLLDFNERTYSDFMNTPIEFQGTTLRLGQISEDILKGLTEDHILELTETGQPVVIGRKLDPVIEYYVHRTLGRRNTVQDSFLRNVGSHSVCAVIGTTVPEIQEIVSTSCSVYEFNFIPSNSISVNPLFIILDPEQAEQQYTEICEMFRDCKIICLERESGRWKWLKSCGDIGGIKKFINPTESFYQIEDITSSSERAISIIGVPGNGKSTLVTQIARMMKAKHPTSWIIRINLSQQMEIFSNFEHIDKNIADMILKMATGSLKLSNFFLESCLKRDANVAILLDGFDEISPNYTSKGCELIKSLLENKSIFKVIVTSRPVTRSAVEEIMCTVSFELHVFNEGEKEIFFEKYLLNKLNFSKRNKDILSKVKDFIGNIDSHIDTKFTAIPLHASILAEALSGDACKFYAQENQTSSNRINILELYESFFEKKITISLIEREGIDYTRPESQNVLNVLRRKHENVHMYLALRALFTYNDLATLNVDVKENVDNAVAQVDSIYEKTGIVYCVDNGKPQFVHKTFAEYFAALWLSKNFNGNSAFVQKLFGRGLEVARDMFDRFLIRGEELHSAVADGDEDRVGYLMSQGRLVNRKDLGGRKPLHVAAIYGSISAARQLLRVTSRLQDADDVLKWTPLKYAETVGSWEVAEMLLAAGANTKGMFQGVKTSESLQGFLKEFAEKGYTNLVRLLIAKGANPNAVLNRERHAALHVAAVNGHVDLVNYLYAGTGRVFSSLRHVFSSSASLASYEALHVASSAAQLGVVRYLATVCDDVDARDEGGWTALHCACGARSRPTEGHVLVVQCLLDAGADASARDAGGWTPLHFAACMNDSRILRILLDAGVDPRIATDDGDTALEISERFGKEETALALLIAADRASTEVKGSRKKFLKKNSDYRRQRSNAVLRIVHEDDSTV